MSRQFKWFLAGQGCGFFAFGLQAVLFPYLIVNLLQEGPERVGIAQMCIMAPALLLMVPGGMLADASDLRTLLARLQLLAVLPVAGLALALGLGHASFALLIAYALFQGSTQAIIIPTRDALLGRIAGQDIQRAVTTAMIVQFLAQVGGFFLAGSASRIGAENLLWLQAGTYVLAMCCALRMKAAPPLPKTLCEPATQPSVWMELAVAFRQIADSSRMGPITFLMCGVGVFFIGVFHVVIPIMVRDYYAGDSVALAMVNGCFVAGVVTAITTMTRRSPVHKQGVAVFLSACGGACLTALFATYPPVSVFYLFIYLFGISAGILMSLGRTIVQESADAHYRARTLAIYSLSFMGGAPIGSLVIGQIAEATHVLHAALLSALGMSLLLVVMRFKTTIWYITRAQSPRS
ncbi:MAG: MFS transporter [Gammaproteobacteria bacterium]|nr:MFS transporter [Gammaproteobacteria bacterium]